jgi:hypothetical protein
MDGGQNSANGAMDAALAQRMNRGEPLRRPWIGKQFCEFSWRRIVENNVFRHGLPEPFAQVNAKFYQASESTP